MKLTRILDWTIILIGLLSTTLATLYVSQKNLKEDRLRFEYETNFLLRRIQNRMTSYESALLQIRAFLRNSPGVGRENLSQYITDTEIMMRYPGIQGIGYTQMISPSEVNNHTQMMRKTLPDYKIFPEGKREIYSSIILLEPADKRNLRAIGFDMFSENVRHKAMIEARDSNQAIMSESIVLIQEDKDSKLLGFNLYLPHYRKDADLSTVEGRRKGLIGFIYSPFRAEQLFKATFEDLNMILDIEIYSEKRSPDKFFYNYVPEYLESDLDKTVELLINGRKLLIRTTPLPNFGRASSGLKTFLVFLFGLMITFSIYSIYLFTRRQMHVARVVANEKEKLLQKEKEHVAARDDFLSIASHELKTPLTSLKLQGQVMLRAINRNDPIAFTPEKVTNLVKQIDNQTTRLTRLVDDMLDISRIRTGRLKIEKQQVDLGEVISDVVERLKPQFMNVIGEIPAMELQKGIVGNWDRFRLEQVLTNLFTNAIRYGNSKPVKVKTTRLGDVARICVIDQGIGIAKENSEKIFERFERAGMSASEVSGLGLGLFITNQIVKAHGGNIRVDSELNQGSTFIVDLPLSEKA